MYNDAREVDNKKTASVVVCSRTVDEISSTVQEIKKVGRNSKVLGIKYYVIYNIRSILSLSSQ
jgi:hypothetical protein